VYQILETKKIQKNVYQILETEIQKMCIKYSKPKFKKCVSNTRNRNSKNVYQILETEIQKNVYQILETKKNPKFSSIRNFFF